MARLRIAGNDISNMCLVEVMTKFLQLRPAANGPLFCHANGSPLTRYQFATVLRKTLYNAGIPARHYGTHSFRIGAATTAAINGVPPKEIQRIGRWRSEAFRSYIRK